MIFYKRLPFTFLFTLIFLQINAQNHQSAPTVRKAISPDQNKAWKQLMADANLALQVKAVSVTDNAHLIPGKDKHDYYSWAPYSWPNPNTKSGYPYITRDGKTNPETEAKSDKPLLRRMAVAVNTLALAYEYSHDLKYAQHAARLIITWFLNPATKMNPNMNYAQCTPGIEKGSPIGIIDSRWFTLVIDAEDILKNAKVLSYKQHGDLQEWFKQYLSWLETSELGKGEAGRVNNHASWYAVQTARYALFTKNTDLAKQIVNASKRFFNFQIDSLGRQKLELGRTKSFDYSLYNLHALIALAQIGDQVGIDLWHYNMEKGNKKNILESIKYMAIYGDESRKWPFQQIAPKAISLSYEDPDKFSVYYPYDLCSALRTGYKVYKDESLLQALSVLPKESIEKNRSVLLVSY